mmetsp:Transcript_23397/g.17820  ORF Transcript_23397/g.17820 Transcript_23397/m.17820 type:complete len:83 (+) Transcript_23397:36-284(+)
MCTNLVEMPEPKHLQLNSKSVKELETTIEMVFDSHNRLLPSSENLDSYTNKIICFHELIVSKRLDELKKMNLILSLQHWKLT